MDKIHEESSLDLSEVIKAAKEQQMEKREQKAREAKHSVEIVTPKQNNPTDLASANHGEFIVGEDGIGGVVIDNEVVLQQMREANDTQRSLLNIVRSDGLIIDANPIANINNIGPDPGLEYIKNNPYDPKADKIREIKKEFAGLTYGLNGLVPIDSEEGKRVNKALESLRTGEVVLPTPEEYEKQKQEALEKRKKLMEERNNNQVEENTITQPQQIEVESKEEQEIKMAEMPENVTIRKGALEQLSEYITDNKDGVVTNTNPINVNNPVEPQPPVQQEEVVKEPINLAEMQLRNSMAKQQPPQPPEQVPVQQTQSSVQTTPESVTIEIPDGHVAEAIQSLPLETYNKISAAKVVRINEVDLKDVPVATRRITDMAEYRRVAQKRPGRESEVAERVLINSGFVITVKAATSLEMATIFVDPDNSEMDWGKTYQFCYEHTITTSVGKMGYTEFTNKVHPYDLQTILEGIYQISETGTRKISITCGEESCKTSYEINVDISKLPDLDSLPQESLDRVKVIMNAKNDLESAKNVQKDSPPSIVKYVQSGYRTFVVRDTTGPMLIGRFGLIPEITQSYNAIIALFVLYVDTIILSIPERDDAPPTVVEISTPELICEELKSLTDDELNMLRSIIRDELTSYSTMTYSIKGPIVCPNCGHTDDSIPTDISDLVFQKVQSALE